MKESYKIIPILLVVFLTSCRQEHMLKKFYKEIDSKKHYWEYWNTDNKTLIFHFGEIGTTGESFQKKASLFESIEKIAQKEAEIKLSEGYKELDENETVSLVFQIKLDAWGTPQDLEAREKYRNFLNELLGWTGNGRCDDGDIGSGTMNLFPQVIDPIIAKNTIVLELEKQKLNINYLIGIENKDSVKIIYPEDYIGTFSY